VNVNIHIITSGTSITHEVLYESLIIFPGNVLALNLISDRFVLLINITVCMKTIKHY